MASFSDIITFTRSSAAWYWDANGVLQKAAADEPRLDHDPATGERLGLLVEESRTNVCLQSFNIDAVDTSEWEDQGAQSFSDASSVLSGGTAQEITHDGSGTSRAIYQDIGTFSGNTETISVIVEKTSSSDVSKIICSDRTDGGGACQADFDWSTESLLNITGSASATKLLNSGPNGGVVYKIEISGSAPSGNNRQIQLWPEVDPVNASVIFHYCGYEEASFATSPIETGSSQVTRAEDVAKITDLSWFNVDEGALFVEFDSKSLDPYQASLLSGGDGEIGLKAQDDKIRFSEEGEVVLVDHSTTLSDNTFYKTAATYGSNGDNAATANGESPSTNTATTNFTKANIFIGSDPDDLNEKINGHIKQIKYWPYRLSDAELQRITS